MAKAIAPNADQEIIGIRPGEKLHEQMIGLEDSLSTYEYTDHYKILPVINDWDCDPKRIKNGKKVSSEFIYNSETNEDWMSIKDLQSWLAKNKDKIGNI